MNMATLILLMGLLDPSALDADGEGAPPPPPPPPPTASHRAEAAPATRRPRREPDPAAVRRLAADDPPIDELRAAATALVMAEPERARSMLHRAQWAAWLPEFRFRVDRRFGRSESLDYPSVPLDTPPPVGLDTVDEVRYEWRASWDLSRIIFNPDELNAHVQALRMADVRREIESLVIRLYFERRRLRIEALTADAAETAAGLRREIRVQELEAELDALTGGAFTRGVAGLANHGAHSSSP
jgi:hypothetical protein